MSTVQTRGLASGIVDAINSIISILGETEGGTFYVSTTGSNSNNGTTLENAFLTLTYALTKVTAGQNDRIFMAPGTYDEPSINGLLLNKSTLTIQGIKSPVTITNSTTTADKVFNITANNITLVNIQVKKGETTSTGSSCNYVDGAANTRFRDVKVIIDKAGFYGYRYTGGAHGGLIGYGDRRYTIITSEASSPIGTGIYFENCYHVLVDNLVINGLGTGLLFGADGDNNEVNPTVTIVYCETGISLQSGASDNAIPCLVVACDTEYSDLSGNASNDRSESMTMLVNNQNHIPKFTGKIWFVSDANGLDTNSGSSPEEAFATIGNALNNANEGDAITIEAGNYYETGLNLNQIGTEIWGEIGVTIYNATGTGLTVSARDCRVNEIVIVAPGQTALDVTGNYNVLSNITCAAPAVGLSISGQGNRVRDLIIGAPTTTGLDISGPYNDI